MASIDDNQYEGRRVAGGFTKHPDYDGLPEAIKAAYSPREYAWLPQPLKDSIIDDEINPEVPEDG